MQPGQSSPEPRASKCQSLGLGLLMIVLLKKPPPGAFPVRLLPKDFKLLLSLPAFLAIRVQGTKPQTQKANLEKAGTGVIGTTGSVDGEQGGCSSFLLP